MRPFAGLRVLDAASMVAGPFAAQLMRWLGADVVRCTVDDPVLDLPGGRDLSDYVNDGKAAGGLTFDGVDVLVCDWTPSEQRARGIDLSRLAEDGVVVACVTAHGLTGPDREAAGCELTAYHGGGEGATLPSENVHRLAPERPPVRAGLFLADFDAGFTAAAAIAGALVGRERGGGGALIDIAIREVEVGLNRTTLSRSWFENVRLDRTYRGYDYAGALRCTDGWVCVRPVEHPHWVAFCCELERPDLIDDPRFATRQLRFDNADALTVELEGFTTTHPRSEVRRRLLRAGCPGGPFLSPRELLTDEAFGSRGLLGEIAGGRAPVRAFHLDEGAAPSGHGLPELNRDLPLDGLRVVDLTWVAAGPYATLLLGFLGADVIRVESASRPDIFRRAQDGSDDLDSSIRFADLNQAKRSIELDLKDPADLDRLKDLIRDAHVLVENYRPGVRDRLGLADETLHRLNPDLVILALSGFGGAKRTLDADRPGYASVFNAESGLGHMTGWPDLPPSDVRDTNDLRAGTNGAFAVLASLYSVARGGGGVVIDVCARDSLVVVQGHLLLAASRGADPIRSGNAMGERDDYGVFPAKDGRYVAVAGATATEVAAAPAGEVVARLRERGLPASLVADGTDLLDDPQLAARGLIRVVDHPRLGPVRLVGEPWVMGHRRTFRPPPCLGEHTAEVLGAKEPVT